MNLRTCGQSIGFYSQLKHLRIIATLPSAFVPAPILGQPQDATRQSANRLDLVAERIDDHAEPERPIAARLRKTSIAAMRPLQ